MRTQWQCASSFIHMWECVDHNTSLSFCHPICWTLLYRCLINVCSFYKPFCKHVGVCERLDRAGGFTM